ncbi:NAD(P)-dependent oxidoreductase [Labrenzia sp. CE80]|uniref:NAD(P)-dependent oxidoreductase n=1 Tax=Labrenzia sp. CE80 TaxID=1788986 RepID=UPI00129A6BEE|nr:NAD(P)-dependent oxidoreductase [Labrenzia sp. CE80]
MTQAVAVVGLGQMGRGIARNLDKAGVLVAASDVQEEAFEAADFSGNVSFDVGQALVDKADIILCVVPSSDEIGLALRGCVAGSNQIIVDLTTSDPAKSQILAGELAALGFSYLDAAMTGGAAGADAGALTLMVGGDAESLAAIRPVLDLIADQVFHLGAVGSGHAMKLVHNMILHSNFLATCEGLRLAERAGLDLNKAVNVLNAGNARSFVSEVRFPRDILNGTMNARSVVANLEKDLGMAMSFAAKMEASVPYGSMTSNILSHAVSTGHGATDFSWLFPLYEELVQSPGDEDDR